MADPITGILKAESGKQQNNALAKLKQGQDAMKQAFLSSASEQMKNVAPQYAPGLQQAMDYASSIGMAGISGTGTQGLEQERAKFGEKRMGEQNQLNDLMNRQMDYRGKALDIESSQADQAIKDQQSVENEVKSLVGDDVNAYQSIMQSIGSDPEMAGMHNAASMAARHAARSGIDPRKIAMNRKRQELEMEHQIKAKYNTTPGTSEMKNMQYLMKNGMSQKDAMAMAYGGVGGFGSVGGATQIAGGNKLQLDQATANEFGVPLESANPYKGMNEATRQKFILKTRENAEKDFAKGADDIANANAVLDDVRGARATLSKIKTGVQNVGFLGTVNKYTDSDLNYFDSVVSKLVPRMRAPGSGATSDFDAKMFQQATIGIDKTNRTNEDILNAMEAQSERVVQQDQFKRNYLDAHGHTRGADVAWKGYMNDNPIFDKNSSKNGGNIVLNKNRMTPQEYFSRKNNDALGAGQQQPSQAAPQQAAAGDFSKASTADLLGQL